MNVNINIISKPNSTTFILFEKINKELLLETKTVGIDGSYVSKTRIDTVIQVGNSRFGVNFKINGFKTDEVHNFSYLTGETSTSHYFKRLKIQGEAEYINYVKEVVKVAIKDYLKLDLDEVTVNLSLPKFN